MHPAKSEDALRQHRISISPVMLTLLTSLVIMAAHNFTFWERLYAALGNQPISMFLFGLCIFAAQTFLITLISPGPFKKPVLAFLLVLGAVTSYYQDRLGATIDREMIQNALTTTTTESKHLITTTFLLRVLFLGLVPAGLVFWVPLRRSRIVRAFLLWLGSAVLYFLIFAAALYSDAKVLMSTGREHQEVTSAIQPFTPIRGFYRYLAMVMKEPIVVMPYGTDAKLAAGIAAADKPVLIVLWVGETARAQSWGLNGAEPDTSPETRKIPGLVNFSNTESCGTATAVSMPCMFSHLTRPEYSHEGALGSENLLDVLSHAGFDVEWWDNNTGDKEIAARLTSKFISERAVPEYCGRGECIDGIFLKLIQEKADTITKNTVLVLHQIGSHGPSYWLRFPENWDQAITPYCQTPDLANCPPAELANAYNTTLRYTDWVVSQSIKIVEASDRVLPMVFYASDHGESLGESGLYLHGAPWFMAPATQTHVPMFLWMSDRYQSTLGLSAACIAQKSDQPVSHDFMFSTILGLAGVETSVRNESLDLTQGCASK